MIHEEICAYKVAKLSKDKGFNEYDSCHYVYEEDLQYPTCTPYTKASHINWSKPQFIAAPTQSLLQRWLREEKGYAISVTAYPTLATMDKVCYAWEIKSSSDGQYMKAIDGEYTFSTYEQALENALKYSLENLV